jgi:hypothetical protein
MEAMGRGLFCLRDDPYVGAEVLGLQELLEGRPDFVGNVESHLVSEPRELDFRVLGYDIPDDIDIKLAGCAQFANLEPGPLHQRPDT